MEGIHLYFNNKRAIPTLRFASPFYDHSGYINTLAESVVNKHRNKDETPFHLFTFHGLPQRHEEEGDPYGNQCRATARLLAEALGLTPDQWRITFQSRFGKDPWLLPATDTTLAQLPAEGHKRLTVLCPGFVSDCLETLEEIAVEGKKTFLEAGGEDFQIIPCLNAAPNWITALSEIVEAELAGW
jgi:protoporphyrin/coproporphyrin ferrochelatase